MSTLLEEPVDAEVETIPLIIRSFERNPDSGGTPARERTNKNMEPAIRGSLLPKP